MTQKSIPPIPHSEEPSHITNHNDPAVLESESFSSGKNLQKAADEAQHERREKARDHIGCVVTWAIYFAAALIAVTVLIYAWHILAPDCWRYLSNNEIKELKTDISQLLIGIIMGFIIKNRFI